MRERERERSKRAKKKGILCPLQEEEREKPLPYSVAACKRHDVLCVFVDDPLERKGGEGEGRGRTLQGKPPTLHTPNATPRLRYIYLYIIVISLL
jgi:hypothetical protein